MFLEKRILPIGGCLDLVIFSKKVNRGLVGGRLVDRANPGVTGFWVNGTLLVLEEIKKCKYG